MWAQSLRNQTLEWEGNFLSLSAPFAAQIRIYTTLEQDQLQLTYLAEGEYQDQTSLAIQSDETGIVLKEIRLPTYYNPQDKLSAHKSIASRIELGLPSTARLDLYATNALLIVEGPLAKTNIALESGRCELKRWRSDARIQTRDASVFVSGRRLAVEGKSREGEIQIEQETDPQAKVWIETISGNIRYQKEQ
ncbi:MAG: hypothetical protein ACON42_07625 [Flavobacteriaceae bacterium]